MNNKESSEKIGQYIKYIVGILFLACVGTIVSIVLLEILGYKEGEIFGFNLLYILLGIWLVILHGYLLDTEQLEYPQYKETVWEARSRRAGELCGDVFIGFLYGLFSLIFLGVLLKWILEIDINEFDKSYRLLPLASAVWIIGLHFYWKHKEIK